MGSKGSLSSQYRSQRCNSKHAGQCMHAWRASHLGEGGVHRDRRRESADNARSALGGGTRKMQRLEAGDASRRASDV